MCHLALALNAHPDYPFVLCSNRDEFSDRPFSPPRVREDGTLYAMDDRSQGTWLGIHVHNGHFATLTNIGGRGGPGGVSRGALTRAFVESPSRARARLEGGAAYRYKGFNLLWCENIRAPSPVVSYLSNCDPDNPAPARPPVTRRVHASTPAGLVIGLGNDLLGDEHVKSPRVCAHVRERLARAPRASAGERETPRARVTALQDALIEGLCERSLGDATLGATLEKFFRWSRSRRLQPGARTTLVITPALAMLTLASLGPSLPSLLLAVTLGLALGLLHHVKMQHLFVDVPAGRRRWTTVAQTVIVVDRHGVIHFAQRRTTLGLRRAGPWRRFQLAPPRSS